MFNISEMAEELKFYYSMKESIYPIEEKTYIKLVVNAIKKFFVDCNHPGEYDRSLYTTDEDGIVYYDYQFDIVQEDYIFIISRLTYLRMIMADVSGDGAVSYTTNALSVTGAKEAYKSVQQEIDDLEHERRIVFHKIMANEG